MAKAAAWCLVVLVAVALMAAEADPGSPYYKRPYSYNQHGGHGSHSSHGQGFVGIGSVGHGGHSSHGHGSVGLGSVGHGGHVSSFGQGGGKLGGQGSFGHLGGRVKGVHGGKHYHH
ncbi:uncharacterized protein LOC126990423 [Eriocheir sinensis]|uniref:uncharacterized protein LOC126990423 n=1 Tax=Eriocheir sinensis TaxID=95602 RepID=UPI0021C7A4BE|nr:uncharacterized protein LOC126990423 [Eriocheir sinensis]